MGQFSNEQKRRLKPLLEGIMRRPEYERDTPMIALGSSPQSSAKRALLRLFPDELTDSMMESLLMGSESDREVAAQVAGDRRAAGDRNLLFSMLSDPRPRVRVAAITGLVKFATNENVTGESLDNLLNLIQAGGSLIAKNVSGYLLNSPESESRATLLHSLANNASALVRKRVEASWVV